MNLEAPAKLNLGLEVLGRREDGFHELATIYQEIDLCDRLSLEPWNELRLDVAGLPSPAGEDNLALRAARLLAEETGIRRGARIRLDKRIPARSGLGGGSSDAAAVLKGLNHLWGTGLELPALLDLAMRLGSDVPFFLVGGTALGLGRGEQVCPLPEVPRLFALVLRPTAGLSTAEVFRRGNFPLTGVRNCNIIRRFAQYHLTGQGIRGLVENDLQPAAEEMLPEVGHWCARLEEVGARAAALSGSGSAVYGLFADRSAARAAMSRIGSEVDAFLCRFRTRPRVG